MKFNSLITLLSVAFKLVGCSSINLNWGEIPDGQRIVDAVMQEFSPFHLDQINQHTIQSAVRVSLPPNCGPYPILDGQYFAYPLPTKTDTTLYNINLDTFRHVHVLFRNYSSRSMTTLNFEIVANNPDHKPHYTFQYATEYLNDEKNLAVRSKTNYQRFTYTIKSANVLLENSWNTIEVGEDGQVYVIV